MGRPAGRRGSTTRRHSAARRGRRQRRERGQSLVIFALTLTMLISISGLAIDATRIFTLYAQLQRAAEAGALAGVLYMPTYYSAPLPPPGDGNSAISRALQETAKNGYGSGYVAGGAYCPADRSSIPIAICPVPSDPYALQVTLTQYISPVMMTMMGFGATRVTATAVATALPQAALGLTARPGTFGQPAQCNLDENGDEVCNGGNNGIPPTGLVATINGPAELKEQGDPFVYCEEGPSTGPLPNPPSTTGADPSADQRRLPYTAPPGVATNHPQYGPPLTPHCGTPTIGGPPGNPDQQPPGYTGTQTPSTAHPGAYNYSITATSGASVWIYNPNFVPHLANGNACDSTLTLDGFWKSPDCRSYYARYGALRFNGYFDDPSFYFDTTFSLYRAGVPYFPQTDTLLLSQTYQPYDQMKRDLQRHGCKTNGTEVYDPFAAGARSTYSGSLSRRGVGCVKTDVARRTGAYCQFQWCLLASGLAAGTYRLAVEATSALQPTNAALGWGRHGYSVAVCASGTPLGVGGGANCRGGGTTTALNNMTVTMSFPRGGRNYLYPLADIPAQYAGRTVTLSVFDVGDTVPRNSIWFSFVPPARGSNGVANPPIPVNYPAWVRTDQNPADNTTAIWASDSGDNIYNGLWIHVTVQLPPNYQGGTWQVKVYSDRGRAQDTVAYSVTVAGSPVRLTR